MDKLKYALIYADYIVAATPHTPETKCLMDKNAITTMKPGVYFVNVARGEVLVGDCLIRVLYDGHLAGTALDMLSDKPLPEDSPSWQVKKSSSLPTLQA